MNIYSIYNMNKYSKLIEVSIMPGRDGTGPWGYGPMTGRGLGPCGMGFRFGAGRDFGRGMGYAPTKEQEIEFLKHHKEFMEETLKEINERLKELESKK
jgi:hypothetical protein